MTLLFYSSRIPFDLVVDFPVLVFYWDLAFSPCCLIVSRFPPGFYEIQ